MNNVEFCNSLEKLGWKELPREKIGGLGMLKDNLYIFRGFIDKDNYNYLYIYNDSRKSPVFEGHCNDIETFNFLINLVDKGTKSLIERLTLTQNN